MSIDQIIFATFFGLVLTSIIYTITGWSKVVECYKAWFTKNYWTNYNILEAISWLVKAVIIVPGLIFEIQLWQIYILALITSMTLIWASNKKMLPTLVAFNTLWIWLSVMVIAKNI